MRSRAVRPVAAPERLRRGEDVRRVLRSRRSRSGTLMVVHLRWRDDDEAPRGTVIAGRRVGRAVERNRAKRRIRAALRELGAPEGADVAVVARAGAKVAPFGRLRSELATLLGEHRDGVGNR